MKKIKSAIVLLVFGLIFLLSGIGGKLFVHADQDVVVAQEIIYWATVIGAGLIVISLILFILAIIVQDK